MRPVVALLTDFGMRDPYVASMKGVVLSLCPDATLVDVTHDVEAQDVDEAAFILDECRGTFPAATVFIVVVDPGVGTSRRGLVVWQGERTYVGPDNGVLDPILADEGAVAREIACIDPDVSPVSATFHGRDVFAPVAARLARGMDAQAVGPVVTDPIRRPFSKSGETAEGWMGRVIHVDRFGNLITNLGRESVSGLSDQGAVVVDLQGSARRLALVGTYADVPAGSPCALIGSGGRLEVAVNGGNAARDLSLHVGSIVRVAREGRGARGTDML